LDTGLSAPPEAWAARRGLRDPRSREPHFRETWDPVQRFRDESLGRELVPPIPVRPLPFPAGPIGYSLSAVDTGCDPGANSSLRVSCLLEASVHLSTAPGSAFPSAPLLGFRPLQRSTAPGARMTRRFHPPAPSVHVVSHDLDGLLRQTPYQACFIPAALLGFHRTRSLASAFRSKQGDAVPGFPLQGSLSSCDERLAAALLPRASPDPTTRNVHTPSPPENDLRPFRAAI